VSLITRIHLATAEGAAQVRVRGKGCYSTQGLNTNKWLTEEFLCDVPGPETEAYAKACQDNQTFGIYSIMERNPDPDKNPFNAAILINPAGEIVLHYRKLQPWTPIEPWYPGDHGMPVADGPGDSKIAIHICHDGMFPELAREAAYQGANAWNNLMYTLAVNLAGYDGVFYYFGEGQVTNFDGTVLVQGQRNPWEIVSGEVYPKMADQARRDWGLENNIYNTGHRGYVGLPGGEPDAGLQWIKDLAAGKYRLPWEDEMKIKDGSIYGYPVEGRTKGGRFGKAPLHAEPEKVLTQFGAAR
jgi:formamidase